MITTHKGRAMAFAATLAGAALLSTACGSSSSSSSTTASSGGSATTAVGSSGSGTTATTSAPTVSSVPSGTLNGSGSTFQLPYDADVITAFDKAHPGVTINDSGGGSGKGQSDLLAHLTDFAASDSIPSNLSAYQGGLLIFPTVVAPITLSYHLSGVKSLTLTAPLIAKIFDGTLKTWNDPAIAAANPGVSLPGTSIVPVHRSDGSGTTNNFTKYLTLADPTDWTLGSGTTINWPGGEAGSGNPGVAKLVQSTPGAIGYVDFSDAVASGLTFASVKNSAGNVEAPSLAGASAAAAGATVNANLSYNPIDSPAPNAYPITSPTYILTYATQSDQTKAAILKGFLDYILTTGQGAIAAQDDFAPLPASLDQMAIAQLSKL